MMMRRLSVERLREHTHRLVERHLEPVEGLAPELGRLIGRYLERPAKLVRPRLLAETARLYGANDRDAVLDLAAGTELLHVFALIHDDRIDGIDRDNQPLPETGDHAVLRVLAGDLLHTVADGVLAETVSRRRLSPQIIETVRHISAMTIGGQVMNLRFLGDGDIPPSRERLFELYDMKTGHYSFSAPLQIGAFAARSEHSGSTGADTDTGTGAGRDAGRDERKDKGASDVENDGEAKALEHMGLLLGRAYQLRDDAADIRTLLSNDPDEVPHWELNLLATFLYETDPSVGASASPAEPARPALGPSGPLGEEAAARRRMLETAHSAELQSWVDTRISELLREVDETAETLSLSPENAAELAAFARELLGE